MDWPGAMRIAKAAAYLDQKSTDAVEKLIRDGELCVVQLTERGDRLIPKSELDAFLMRRMDQKVVGQK